MDPVSVVQKVLASTPHKIKMLVDKKSQIIILKTKNYYYYYFIRNIYSYGKVFINKQ